MDEAGFHKLASVFSRLQAERPDCPEKQLVQKKAEEVLATSKSFFANHQSPPVDTKFLACYNALTGRDQAMWAVYMEQFHHLQLPPATGQSFTEIKQGTVVVPFVQGGSHDYPLNCPCVATADGNDRFKKLDGSTGNHLGREYTRCPTLQECILWVSMTLTTEQPASQQKPLNIN